MSSSLDSKDLPPTTPVKRHHRHRSATTARQLAMAKGSSNSTTTTTTSKTPANNQREQQCNGKENHNEQNPKQDSEHNADEIEERFCFECRRSLSKSRHLINIAGRIHKWHPECFKCNVCNHPMDKEATCHLYKDKIVCREDYAKLQRDNSIRCSRCRWPIGASDWVRRAGSYVYHLACFSCDVCFRQLSTGEQFTINIQDKHVVRLLCRLHFDIDNQPSRTTSATTSDSKSQHHHHHQPTTSTSTVTTTLTVGDHQHQAIITRHETQVGSPPPTQSSSFDFSAYSSRSIGKFHQPNNATNQQSDQHYLHLLSACPTASTSSNEHGAISSSLDCHQARLDFDEHHGLDEVHLLDGQSANSQLLTGGASTSSSNGSSNGGLMGAPSKSKRVRTTFTEEQLSILQTHFQIDSNPDGQDLERIATITGLSKRVTQVWFQNSRARQKKYLIKRKPSSGMSSGGGGSNTIMGGGNGGQLDHFSTQSQHLQHHHHLHQQQQSRQCKSVDCFDTQQQQQKWSNMSDRSELSVGQVEELEDTQSSDDQLVMSEDSNN